MAESLRTVLMEERGDEGAIRVLSAVVDTAARASRAERLPATTRAGAIVVKETMGVVLAVLEGRLDPDAIAADMPSEPGTRGLDDRGFLPPEVTKTIVKESLTLLFKVIQGGLDPDEINLNAMFVDSTTEKLAAQGVTEADIQRILGGSSG